MPAGDSILGPDDPAPVRRVNERGGAAALIVCDHASRTIPRAMECLGLGEDELSRHIAWDIGAAAVTEALAERLDAPALFAGYSRLVIDCNRYPTDPASAPAESDGTRVPGNRDLDTVGRLARATAVHLPYHAAIGASLDAFQAGGVTPVLLSVHTMTSQPSRGAARRWHLSVCWRRDDRLAAPVLRALHEDGALVVGDNEPYGLDLGEDYTVPEHAMRRGLAHLQIEIRQDLVERQKGADEWAERLAAVLERPLADPHSHRVRRYWPRREA